MGKKQTDISIISNKIYTIRGKKVMLDKDLAELYSVETKYLKRQVTRHINRFPVDFMFELTKNEFNNLRCQIDTSSWGGTRYQPYAFTEQGIAMLSSVLSSEIAIKVNIQIMRAFVAYRRYTLTTEGLKRKLKEIENKIDEHDEKFQVIFKIIKQLLSYPDTNKRPIGFNIDK